eukprot:gene5950-6397_t
MGLENLLTIHTALLSKSFDDEFITEIEDFLNSSAASTLLFDNNVVSPDLLSPTSTNRQNSTLRSLVDSDMISPRSAPMISNGMVEEYPRFDSSDLVLTNPLHCPARMSVDTNGDQESTHRRSKRGTDYRKNQSAEKRALRLQRDAERHRQRYAKENEEERARRLQRDALRHRLKYEEKKLSEKSIETLLKPNSLFPTTDDQN